MKKLSAKVRRIILAAAKLAAHGARSRAERRRRYLMTYLRLRRVALKVSR